MSNIVPILPARGLLPSEVSAARAWAHRHGLALETGTADNGAVFATVDVGAALGLPLGHAVWCVAREARHVVAFDQSGRCLAGAAAGDRTVGDVLAALASRLPGREGQA